MTSPFSIVNLSTASHNLAVLKTIPLTQGFVATVDATSFDDLNQFKWHAARIGRSVYARRCVYANGVRSHEYMHRRILGDLIGMEIDHIDHNGCHNFRANLRHVTATQNSWNMRIDIRNKSGVSGVSWWSAGQCWRAKIGHVHLGRFIYFTDAVAARREAEQRLHGEFARAA